MAFWINYSIVVVLLSVYVQIGNSEDGCSYCVGEQFECINGFCYCANNYVPNYQHTDCEKCPGLGEKCYGPCCSNEYNVTLQCWRGFCHSCYSPNGNWICRDSMGEIILISGSQIIMAVALVLGIIATFSLLYKLCTISNLRPQETHPNEARLSVGSLQIYVNERLRDAPPRYTRAPASGSAIYPASVYLNAGFVHDNSLPPPLYTPERKTDNEPNATVHI